MDEQKVTDVIHADSVSDWFLVDSRACEGRNCWSSWLRFPLSGYGRRSAPDGLWSVTSQSIPIAIRLGLSQRRPASRAFGPGLLRSPGFRCCGAL